MERSPLCIAISKDEGKSWSSSRVIEADPDGWYCYTAMALLTDRVLLAYCAGDLQVGGLNRLKVVALSKQQLSQAAAIIPTRAHEQVLLDPCLDDGHSFINTKTRANSPRFWIESHCCVIDEKANQRIAFRNPYWADFIVDQPTPVNHQLETGGEARKQTAATTYHYSGHVHHSTRNVLIMYD